MNKRKYIPLSMVLGKILDTDLNDIPKGAKNLLTLEMSTVLSWIKTNDLHVGKFEMLLQSRAKELDLGMEDYTSIYEALVTNVYHNNGTVSVSPIKRDIAMVCYFLENNHILRENEVAEFIETVTGMPCNSEEQVAFDGDIVMKVEE